LCVHNTFESQARRHPHAVAVALGDETLTYAALNARANGLALRLIDLGVGPDCLVGICLERSPGLIVGMLAILKAGGAYVPLDPAYPKARLDFILRDTGMRTLVTEAGLAGHFSGFDGTLVINDRVGDDTDPPPRAGPEHLAYIIYTSGSTGAPKGVMIEHRNLTALFAASERHFDFSERDVWTLFHSVAFDFSVWEIWGALLHGGRLEIVPREIARSARDFARLLAERKVTILNQTPSAFLALIRVPEMDNRNNNLALRQVIFGGEALNPAKLKPWRESWRGQPPALVNMYGITETTIHVTHKLLTIGDLDSPQSVIGRPLDHLGLHVLDEAGRPVPCGGTGEIHVSGAGLARGYINRPELTAARFITDSAGARVYRTGDLAKRLPDGGLAHLGRKDQQVKIRGFRIELGEIESALCTLPDVADAAVIEKDGRLMAYVVPRPERAIDTGQIRRNLAATLPGYMVPAAITPLAALPLTPNGKIDHAALPAPIDLSSRPYVAPRTAAEKRIAEIWSDVLKRDRVGAEDDFFELGGDSLLATEIALRMAEELGIDASLAELFEKPVLKDFAAALATTSFPLSRERRLGSP